MPAIGLHGALPCDSVCFMLARTCRLQLAPQTEGTPAFFGDAADELVDEGELRLDQGEREVGFHHEEGRELLADKLRGNSSGGTGTSCCVSSARCASIRVASADRRSARWRRSATASSGGSTGNRLSPAANCGNSLTGSRSRSCIQARSSSYPEGVRANTVRSGRLPSREVSLAAMKPRFTRNSITV